jgi:hypothetical protein
LLVATAFLVTAVAIYGLRVADADLFGHLAYGRFFWQQGGARFADPFSYTTAGLTWYCHEYLSQIVLWLTYAVGGSSGLIALKCLIGGAAAMFSWRALGIVTRDARIRAPVLMLTACLLERYLYFRPQLFTFFFFSLFVLVVIAHLYGTRGVVWILPPSLALWANLHGGFAAGIGAVGLGAVLAASRAIDGAGAWYDTRELLGVLAICLLASLATPLGWSAWVYLAVKAANPLNRQFIAEWQPLQLDWTGGLVALLVALTLTAGIEAERRGARPSGIRPVLWLAAVAPVAILAVRSHRHVPLLAIWTAPVLAALADAALGAQPFRRGARLALLGATLFVGLASAFQMLGTLADPQPRIHAAGYYSGVRSPVGAASLLRATGRSGRLYAPLWWGSYLTWELYPRIQVSSDGREDSLYRLDQIGENLAFYTSRRADIDAPLRVGSDFVLVPRSAPVLGALLVDRRWRLLFEDQDSALFVRDDDAHADLVLRSRERRLSPAERVPPRYFE